jgi:hypothetical protein
VPRFLSPCGHSIEEVLGICHTAPKYQFSVITVEK